MGCQGARVARRKAQAVLSGLYQFGHPAQVACQHRRPVGESLQNGVGTVLVPHGRHHQHVQVAVYFADFLPGEDAFPMDAPVSGAESLQAAGVLREGRGVSVKMHFQRGVRQGAHRLQQGVDPLVGGDLPDVSHSQARRRDFLPGFLAQRRKIASLAGENHPLRRHTRPDVHFPHEAGGADGAIGAVEGFYEVV